LKNNITIYTLDFLLNNCEKMLTCIPDYKRQLDVLDLSRENLSHHFVLKSKSLQEFSSNSILVLAYRKFTSPYKRNSKLASQFNVRTGKADRIGYGQQQTEFNLVTHVAIKWVQSMSKVGSSSFHFGPIKSIMSHTILLELLLDPKIDFE